MLDLSHNRLKTFPKEILDLPQLTVLQLTDNQLDSLPAAVSRLTHLQVLHLVDNHIRTWPASLASLPLTDLQVRGNPGTPLIHLRELALTRVHQGLAEALQEPTRVYRLQLHDETSLSAGQLSQFPNLQELDLSNSRLQELPSDVGALSKLQVLDVSNTPLTTLPAEIGQLSAGTQRQFQSATNAARGIR